MASARRKWLKALKNNSPRKAGRRPLLEQLEDRVVPSINFPKNPPAIPSPLSQTGGLYGSGSLQGGSSSTHTVFTPPYKVKADQSSTAAGEGYTPAQIEHAYGFDQLPGSTYFPDLDYNHLGSGQTIAIIDPYQDPNIAFDLQQFDEYFSIGGAINDPTSTGFFTAVNEYGDSASSVPAGPSGFGVETSLDVEWAHAIAPGANILLVEANSFSEADINTATEFAANAPGVSVVNMSFGGFEFYQENWNDVIYTTPLGHQGVTFVASSGDNGAGAQYLAVSPNVLSVGGTTLPTDVNGNPDLTQESGWSGSGGGPAFFENVPAFQQGVATQSGLTSRGTPDVAYDADPNTGFPVYDSLDYGAATPWNEVGGTSIAAPQWAALVAIADQGRVTAGATSLDGPNQTLPAIYQIAQSDSSAFNDITTGSNGYNAGSGYDLVTGLGTPNAQNLVPDLVNYSAPAQNTVYWTGDAGDNNWNDPGNWSLTDPLVGGGVDGVLPGPNSDVVVDIDGATINHGMTWETFNPNIGNYAYYGPTNYDTIRSLTVTGANVTITLGFGTLDLSGSGSRGKFQVDQSGDLVALDGGTLKDSIVTGNTTITSTTNFYNNGFVYGYSRYSNYNPIVGNVLYGVQLDGTLDLSQASGEYAVIEGGMILNGTILVGGNNTDGSFLFVGGYDTEVGNLDNTPEFISGSGTIVFGQGYYDDLLNNGFLLSDGTRASHATLTIGKNITMQGGGYSFIGDDNLVVGTEFYGNYAYLGYADYYYATPIDIQGTVHEDIGGEVAIETDGNPWTNDGSVEIGNDGFAYLDGSGWVNNGSIEVDNSAFAYVGPFGSWTNNGSVTMDNFGEAYVGLYYSWTNNGSVTIESGGEAELVNFEGSWSNNGSVQISESQFTELYGATGWNNSSTGQITVTEGSSVYLSEITDNAGSIIVDNSYTDVYGQPWTNDNGALISATDGANLTLDGEWTNYGTILGSNSTVNLGDASNGIPPHYISYGFNYDLDYLWSNEGTISISGSTVNLGGFFTTDTFDSLSTNGSLNGDVVFLTGSIDNSVVDNPNSLGVLSLNAATGPLNVENGAIDQGTIETSGGNDLVVLEYDSIYLNDVTLDGTLDLSQFDNASAYISNGMTLNGTILLGGDYNTTNGNCSLYFGNFAYYYFNGTFADNTPQTISGTGTIQFGEDSVGDFIQNLSNETITIGPSVTIVGGLTSYISSSNSGIESAIDNLGTIEENLEIDTANGPVYGNLQMTGQIANYDASNETFSGGTWEVDNGASLDLFGVNIVNDNANLVVGDTNPNGTGSTIFSDQGSTDALTGLTSIGTAGGLTVTNGYSFFTPGDFSNAGALTVTATGGFFAGGDYTQTAGSTTVDSTSFQVGGDLTQSAGIATVDGTLMASNYYVNGGSLTGGGTVEAEVFNADAINPGDGPGVLSILGDYTQTSTGILNSAIGDHASTGTFGQLSVSGTATLDGTLNVSEVGNFIPSPGDDYSVVTSSAQTGTFATINGLALTGGLAFSPDYDTTGSPNSATLDTMGNPTITVVDGTFVYDGHSHFDMINESGFGNVDPNPTSGTTTVMYTYPDGTITSTEPVDAGVYQVNVTFTSDDPNYSDATGTGTLTITPRVLTVSATANNKTYDSTTTASVTLSNNGLARDSLTQTFTSAFFLDANAGTSKTVEVTGISLGGPGASNYTFNTTTTANANITPRTLTVTGVTAVNKTYDGTTVATLNTSNAALSGVQGSDSVTLVTTGAVGTFANATAGTGKGVTVTGLTITGTAVAAGDYLLTQPTTTANITAKALTVSGITANNKPYDGTTSATLNLGGAALVGLQGSDSVTLTTSGATGTFASANFGSAITVSITGITISGALVSAGDYTVTQPSTTANITSHVLSVTGITADNKIYDGMNGATINTGSAQLSGLQGSDTVTLNTSGASASFASANVGTGILVNISGVTISGALVTNGDYSLTQPTSSASITPRTLTVTGITAGNKVYDATTSATLNVTNAALSGVQSGDNIALNASGATGEFVSTNVANGIVVTVAGLSISGGPVTAGDYTLTEPTTTANIMPRTLTVSGVTANNKVYDATTNATLNLGSASLVGVQGGDSVALSTTGATGTFVSANASINSIGVTISGLTISGTTVTAGDYTLTQPTTTADITPHALTVTGITASNKVYDSTTTATLSTNGAALAGVQGNDNVTLGTNNAVGAFNTADVGTGKTVTVSGVTISGITVSAGDYTLTQPTTTANITPRALTVTGITGTNKEYDSTTAASFSIGSATLNGVQGSDSVALSATGATATFATPAMGTGKTVTVTGLSISGPQVSAGDYTLTEPSSTTANITPRALTVTGITADNKVYDSTTAATLNLGGATLVGVQGSDVVSLTTTGATGTFASVNVGNGISVTINGVSISGALVTAGDYTLTLPVTTSANITPQTLTVTGITAANKVYDATTGATLNLGSSVGLQGVQGNDSVILGTTGASGTFASANVGTGIGVAIAGLTISGTAVAAGDYTLTQPTTTANITPRALSVTGITASDKEYDSTTNATLNLGNAALVGVQFGDQVTLNTTHATGSFATADQGTGQTVTVTGLGISGTAVTAGDYSLTLPFTTTASITPRVLTVTGITAANKVFDSTTTATLNLGGATLVGVQGNDDVTLATNGAAGTFATSAVGNGITVTVNGVSISGATVSAGDYTLVQPITTTANITPPLTWTTPFDISYGTPLGSTQLDATTTVAGTYTYSPPSGTLLNVGSGQTLTVTFTPTDTADYPTLSKTVTINVTPAATSISIVPPTAVTQGLHSFVTVNVGPGLGVPTDAGLPTGNVQLTVNGTMLTSALTNGSATFDVGELNAGTYPLSVSYSAQGNFAAATTSGTSLTVNPVAQVTVTTSTLPTATAQQSYSDTVTGTGGTGKLSFSLASGSLPVGLNLDSSGNITGTPSVVGSYTFAITATDSLGISSSSASFTVLVNPASWTVGNKGYFQTIPELATDTYTLTPKNGLPKGLSFNAVTGVISGTPSKAGTFNFTIVGTPVGSTTSNSSQVYSLTVNSALTFATKSLAPWTVNAPGYSANIALSANTGTGNATFKVSAGKLPTGLTLDPTSGTISGTPTATGNFSFTITAIDSVSATVSKAYKISIAKAPTLAPAKLPNGSISSTKTYSATVTASGGTIIASSATGGYTFAMDPSTPLPGGLTINPVTPRKGAVTSFKITGAAPTVAGTYTFDIIVTDAVGGTNTVALTVKFS